MYWFIVMLNKCLKTNPTNNQYVSIYLHVLFLHCFQILVFQGLSMSRLVYRANS